VEFGKGHALQGHCRQTTRAGAQGEAALGRSEGSASD
jgi:hypothetical protein